MAKYHINEKGNPGVCKAQQACPFGSEKDHYASKEEARASYEAKMASLEAVSFQFEAAMRRRDPVGAARRDRKEACLALLEKEAQENPPAVEAFYKKAAKDDLRNYNEAYATYSKSLTKEELKVIDDYTGILYDPMNVYLATGFQKFKPDYEETMKEKIALLDSAIAKAPAQNRTLYRRLDQDEDEAGNMVSAAAWANTMGLVPGKKITVPAFASTTTDPAYIARTAAYHPYTSVVLVIEASKGAPVGETAEDNRIAYTQQSEREILLPRDERYEVVKIEHAQFEDTDEIPTVLTIHLKEIASS